MAKKTIFNKVWLDSKLHPEFCSWLSVSEKHSDEAYCKICQATISLSNMGRRALDSHMKSVKHVKVTGVLSKSSQNVVTNFFSSPGRLLNSGKMVSTSESTANVSTASASTTTAASLSDLTASVSTSSTDKELSMEANINVNFPVKAEQSKRSMVSNYVSGDDVTKAEVLWAMKCVMNQYSMNSSSDVKEIFQLMFSDSSIAKKMTIGSTKLAYSITYGLAPYFHNQLLRSILLCDKVVVCFDEAFNKISQRGQMDIVVRYWNENTNSVSSRYFGSSFMGFSAASDILASFKEALTAVPLNKIMQVSMDGPAVNWKFTELLNESLEEENKLLDMGSCGLHVVNGAFQTGHKASGWKVNSYLRALYQLLKDSPARRAVYTEITGSQIFRSKFCQVRWVEYASVVHRAIEVLPHIKKFIEGSKKLPTTVTCTNVQELCLDKLAEAKIAFFASIASDCEIFLRKYQSAKPLAPFLYDDLGTTLRCLMKRFVKKSVIESADFFVKKSVIESADSVSKLLKINVEDKDTRCTYKEVDIGVAANKSVSVTQISDAQRLQFRIDCINFLSALVSKIISRSPLKYNIVRAISCLVPGTIANSRTVAENRMKDLLQNLYEKNIIKAVTADRCKSQFSDLCAKATKGSLVTTFVDFSCSTDRLDTFYYNIIGTDRDFSDLFHVIRLILILSHGNASVESGFSVNGDMLVDNLHEDSLIAQRTVYDAVQNAGGVASVNVDKALLSFVRGSHARYLDALEKKRKATKQEEELALARKRTAEQIKVLKNKKSKVVEEAKTEAQKLDLQIAELSRLQ